MIVAPDYTNSSGYAALYAPLRPRAWDAGLSFLRDAGMSIIDPWGAAKVTAIQSSGADVGGPLSLSEEDFLRKLDEDESVWFRTWTQDRDDMVCGFERVHSVWCEHYVIGTLARDSESFVETLLDRTVQDTRRGHPRLLVVDWGAAAEGFDWAGLWNGAESYLGEAPDLVVIPDPLRDRFRPPSRMSDPQELPGHVLLSPPRSPPM